MHIHRPDRLLIDAEGRTLKKKNELEIALIFKASISRGASLT